MRRLLKITLLGSALVAPGAFFAVPVAQGAVDDHPKYRDEDRKDDHVWTEKEEKAYRKYLKEHHKAMKKFDKMNSKEQKEYWEWRHKHPEDIDQ